MMARSKKAPGYRLDWRQDEHLKIYLGRRLVSDLNHDEQGNDGMNAAAEIIRNLAEMQNVPIKEVGQ